MKSHSYNLSASEWRRLILAPFLAFASFVLVMQIFWRCFPNLHGTSSENTTAVIIEEKARLSHSRNRANTVLIGDSSCLMDVSFVEMKQCFPGLVVCNLGTLSTLGLPHCTALLRSYLGTQGIAAESQGSATDQTKHVRDVKLVVLLMTPQMIRTADQRVARVRTLDQESKRRVLIAQKEHERTTFEPSHWLTKFYDVTMVSRIRTEIADPLLSVPLLGRWGQLYGSPRGFRRYLTAHEGCAIDPSDRATSPVVPSLKSANVSSFFLSQCEEFGRSMPQGVRLVLCLTPIPQSEADPGYSELVCEVARQLKSVLKAESAQTSLPSTFPDHYFATSTHLNEGGARLYSHYLGRALLQKKLASSVPVSFKLNGR